MDRAPVGRRGVGAIETIRRLDPGTILATILVLGLVLRVLIAGIYLPLSGLGNDMGAFNAWGQRMAAVGPGAFYEPGYFADYPPGYLYVLWLLGEVGGALTPLVGQNATGGLVKVPGILADIGVAWLLFMISVRWSGELLARSPFRVAPQALGIAAATVYLFNPGVIFDSAVWGQVDSVGTLVLLGTIYALGRGWTEVAAVGAVLALLVKFQFGFLVPIVLIVGLKRHLFARSSDPAHAGRRDLLRVLTSLAAGVVALTLLLLPFGMTIFTPQSDGPSCFGFPPADASRSLIGKFCEASQTYSGLTIAAFNLWRNPISGLGDTFFRGDDTTVALILGGIGLTWQQVGTVLFGVVAAVALWQVARRDDLRGILLASLLIAIAFFVLPTRVHERYLFPTLALAAPLLLSSRTWPWIYGGLSLTFFANIYWAYTEDWSFSGRINNPGLGGQPMPQDPFLTSTLLTDIGIWLLCLLGVILLLAVLWRSLRHALRPADVVATAPPPPAPAAVRAPALRPVRGRGPRLGWLAANPADAYLREPVRGLDRRDALILLALVVFAFVFRLWRLDVPRSQHFDEVYHGRSATEWLSAWQEGWDRDVYEWTHPMLAKYLIAGGILVADPNSVVGSSSIGAASANLVVAPKRESQGYERSVAFTTEGSSTIVATDATSGEELARWQAGGPIATLAHDAEGPTLLVGRADEGTVDTYELAGMLASADGRAPPAGPPIETELGAVNEIVVPASSSDPLLLRGPEMIAVVDRATDAVLVTAPGQYGGAVLVQGIDEDPDRIAATDIIDGALQFLDASSLEPVEDEDRVEIEGASLIGPLVIRGSGDDQVIFALTGPVVETDEHPATLGGYAAVDADERSFEGVVPLPGSGTLIGHQRVAGMVYVAGSSASGEPEVWAIEPHVEARRDGTIGGGVFDTTPLPGAALALAFDVASTSQGDDHARLLVSTADDDGAAAIVRVDAGSNAFAWRLSGILFGAILVGLVYLLTAALFGRRRIAILAAGFVAIDGMSFVMSRIAMNDIYVTVFVVAAYTLFWQVWSGRWARSAWWAMPIVGVLIGLAAATKWVGFYALAGLLVLVLARSNLGRLLLVAGVALAAIVGGIGAPWPFLVIMLGILGLAMLITWARPIRIDVGEALIALPATVAVLTGIGLAFVLAFDSVESSRSPGSAVEYLFGLLARGAEAEWPAFVMLGVAAVLIAWRAFASLRNPASDARWWHPTALGGFGWSWVGACLVIVPLTVYALSYVPYLQLGHDWAAAGGPGYGWSLEELHAQMFGYHYNLTAGHASSSPWWSWPLALKPTWFFNGSYDTDQIAVIYNGGNPILFWAGIPAIVACAALAWKRRSVALVLVVAAFAFQLVPWVRIERATFAYHYFTAVIFAMIAIAYLVDELLRRPAWRDLALGYLGLVLLFGILIFPLGSALPMPDWYINAARALPPWNYAFQFPDPPSGDRADLLTADTLRLVLGGLVAVVAVAFAVRGRDRWERGADEAPRPIAPAADG